MNFTAQDIIRSLDRAAASDNEAVKDALSQLLTVMGLSQKPIDPNEIQPDMAPGPLEQMFLDFNRMHSKFITTEYQLDSMRTDYAQMMNMSGHTYNPLSVLLSRVQTLETQVKTLENKLSLASQTLLGVAPSSNNTLSKTYSTTPSNWPITS